MPYEQGPQVTAIVDADKNNYAPGGPGGGWDIAQTIILQSVADREVSGFARPTVNNGAAVKYLVNASDWTITIDRNSLLSAVGNRVDFVEGGAGLGLNAGKCMVLVYDFFSILAPAVVPGLWRGYLL